jgi:hypothetical protein
VKQGIFPDQEVAPQNLMWQKYHGNVLLHSLMYCTKTALTYRSITVTNNLTVSLLSKLLTSLPQSPLSL